LVGVLDLAAGALAFLATVFLTAILDYKEV